MNPAPTDSPAMLSRRTVLVAGIAVAGTAGLAAVAGCSAKSSAAATGAVIQGPAPRPLAAIPIKVEGGNVVPA